MLGYITINVHYIPLFYGTVSTECRRERQKGKLKVRKGVATFFGP